MSQDVGKLRCQIAQVPLYTVVDILCMIVLNTWFDTNFFSILVQRASSLRI